MIEAKVIADSVNDVGTRLTTLEVTMHRFVLAEFNTHRVFSRNSASSRAIPVGKQLERVETDPAWPIVWAAEQRGMQGGDFLQGTDLDEAYRLFADVHGYLVERIGQYLTDHQGVRLHKSLVNRLLEPFMWHKVIVTSSDWSGFWRQRCSPLAQPEMRLAAEEMQEAYDESEPKPLKFGGMHLPYVSDAEREAISSLQAIRSSVSRCTRVSYLNHGDGKPYEDENRLVADLLAAEPRHESPFEHVAQSIPGQHPGNFGNGWLQLRHNPDMLSVLMEEPV